MSDPIFRAAAIEPASVEIFILNNSSLNAFVTGGRTMILSHRHAGDARYAGATDGGDGARDRPHHRRTCGWADRGDRKCSGSPPSSRAFLASARPSPAAAAPASAPPQQAKASRRATSSAFPAAKNRAPIKPPSPISSAPASIRRPCWKCSSGLQQDQGVFAASGIDPYLLTHPLSRARINALDLTVQRSSARGGRAGDDASLLARPDAREVGRVSRPAERVTGGLAVQQSGTRSLPRGDLSCTDCPIRPARIAAADQIDCDAAQRSLSTGS